MVRQTRRDAKRQLQPVLDGLGTISMALRSGARAAQTIHNVFQNQFTRIRS